MNSLRILFCGLVLCLSSAITPAQVLEEAVFNVPYTLDPHREFWPDWDRFYRMVYETPLVCGWVRGELRLEPRLLAELPVVEDEGLTMRLRFRAGIRFVDDPCFQDGKGRALVAKDFAQTLLRHADPATQSKFYASYLQARIRGLDLLRDRAAKEGVFDYDVEVPGIVVENSTELTLHLTSPYPQLPALMTMAWASVVPREAISRYGSGLDRRTVGTGPYQYDAAHSDDRQMSFVARPDYWNATAGGKDGALPRNAGVRLHILADPAIHEKRFAEGDLSVLDLQPDAAARFVNSRGALRPGVRPRGTRVLRSDRSWVHYVSFNMNNKILGKKKVRQALCLAVDRQDFIEAYYQGAAVPANHPVPPSIPMALPKPSPDWSYGKADLEQARRLLAEAGYPEGEGLPEFVLDSPGDNRLSKLESAYLKKAWSKIGVKIQERLNGDFADFQTRSRNGLLEISINYWFADYPDAENFWVMLSSSAVPRPDATTDTPNIGFYDNPDFDRLWERSGRLAPGPERGKIYATMIDLVQEDCPWLFLAHQEKISLIAPGVRHVDTRNQYAIDYARIAIQEPK
ncbi:MAG: hypothetical protein KDB53_00630 [Planctomycetes bacterium]|nr:hypothetical protein [Planctomycetota bacterium]